MFDEDDQESEDEFRPEGEAVDDETTHAQCGQRSRWAEYPVSPAEQAGAAFPATDCSGRFPLGPESRARLPLLGDGLFAFLPRQSFRPLVTLRVGDACVHRPDLRDPNCSGFRHARITRWARHLDPFVLHALADHTDMNIAKRRVHPSEADIREAMDRLRSAVP